MTTACFASLENRGVLALAGPDTLPFLQGIVTNDVDPAAAGRPVFAALLTPQGKYLHDFFLVPSAGRFLLDCERGRIDDLRRRLAMYRLRAKVTIDDASEQVAVFTAFGDGAAARLGLSDRPGDGAAFGDGIAFVDPRLPRLGARALLPRATGAATLEAVGLQPAPRGDYDRQRRLLGIAEGSGEIGVERTLALEAGLDVLNGVSFAKGCYVGQEVTSRMHNRKLVKKRIVPVTIDGPTPASGTPVMRGESEAGEVCAAEDGIGLALLRLESLAQGATLSAGPARLIPRPAEWLALSRED